MATAQIERESVTTKDVDAAREGVAAVFCPHGLEPRGTVDLRLRAARADQVGIIHLDYGATVEISPEPLEDFYLVQIPRSGAARVAQRRSGDPLRPVPRLRALPVRADVDDLVRRQPADDRLSGPLARRAARSSR